MPPVLQEFPLLSLNHLHKEVVAPWPQRQGAMMLWALIEIHHLYTFNQHTCWFNNEGNYTHTHTHTAIPGRAAFRETCRHLPIQIHKHATNHCPWWLPAQPVRLGTVSDEKEETGTSWNCDDASHPNGLELSWREGFFYWKGRCPPSGRMIIYYYV